MSTLYYHPRRGGKATKVTANRLAVLDTIRERADAATPGPWATALEVDHDGQYWVVTPPDGSVLFSVCKVGHKGEPKTEEDAEFIAHARTDIPALLAHIDALHTLLVNLVDGIDGYWASLPDNQLHIDALENITGKRVKRDS